MIWLLEAPVSKRSVAYLIDWLPSGQLAYLLKSDQQLGDMPEGPSVTGDPSLYKLMRAHYPGRDWKVPHSGAQTCLPPGACRDATRQRKAAAEAAGGKPQKKKRRRDSDDEYAGGWWGAHC